MRPISVAISLMYGRFWRSSGGFSLIYSSLFLKQASQGVILHPLTAVFLEWIAIYKRNASGRPSESAIYKPDMVGKSFIGRKSMAESRWILRWSHLKQRTVKQFVVGSHANESDCRRFRPLRVDHQHIHFSFGKMEFRISRVDSSWVIKHVRII